MFQTEVLGKIKTHILCAVIPPTPSPENRAIYEIMWKNMVKPDGPHSLWQFNTVYKRRDPHKGYGQCLSKDPCHY
jgi:hypothetical protein